MNQPKNQSIIQPLKAPSNTRNQTIKNKSIHRLIKINQSIDKPVKIFKKPLQNVLLNLMRTTSGRRMDQTDELGLDEIHKLILKDLLSRAKLPG